MDDLLAMMNDRLDRIENKLDSTLKFKWLAMGIVTGVTTICGVIFSLMRIL